MKIYNEQKTELLGNDETLYEYNHELGELRPDKLFIAHHEATPFIKGKTAEEDVAERVKGGARIFVAGDDCTEAGVGDIIRGKDRYHLITKVFPEKGGQECVSILSVPDTPAKDAWNEEEDIYIYHEFTTEEREERRLNHLRARREPLLMAFDKWEKAVLRGREDDNTAVMAWFNAVLDLDEDAINNVPERVRYYL